MFENFDELMDETMEELQENETMEQNDVLKNGEDEISPDEAEAVGRGEYSPEARANAWNEYNRLSGKDRENFLRGHSRNAHIMNTELHREHTGSTTGEGETDETSEDKETAGYSSSYYEHQMASALEKGNKIAYNNARSNWAKAKVRESVGSTTGEGGEEAHDSQYYEKQLKELLNPIEHHQIHRPWSEVKNSDETPESAGYSSDYYKHELATAKNDIQRDYALKNYRAALARETVGSTTGTGEVDEVSEEKEAAGYSSSYYEHQMASALEKGNKIAYDNARSNWAKAKVRESVGSTTG